MRWRDLDGQLRVVLAILGLLAFWVLSSLLSRAIFGQ